MSEPDASARPSSGSPPTLDHILERVQRLGDMPRPESGYPLAVCVEGYLLGDITAIVAAAVRAERLREMTA